MLELRTTVRVMYDGAQKPWADWIASQLHEAEYQPVLMTFGDASEKSKQTRRNPMVTLVVVAEQSELGALVHSGARESWVPVRVGGIDPTGWPASVDLVGLDERSARATLLQAVESARQGRHQTMPGRAERVVGLAALTDYLSEQERALVLEEAMRLAATGYDRSGGTGTLASLAALAVNLPGDLGDRVWDELVRNLIDPWTHGANRPARMLGLLRGVEDPRHRDKVLAALAPRLANLGYVSEALEAVQSIQIESLRGQSLSRLAPIVIEHRGTDILEILRAISDDSVKAAALVAIAQSLPGGFVRAAVSIASEIQRIYDRNRALASLAMRAAEIDDSSEAINICGLIGSAYTRSRTLSAVAGTMATAGSPAPALHLVEAIEQDAARADGLKRLAPSLPVPLLEQALAIADAIETGDSRNGALAVLAPRLAELGFPGRALDMVANMSQPSPRAKAVGDLGPFLPEALFDDALEIVRALPDDSARSQALTTFTPWLPSHVLHKALEIARGIEDERLRLTAAAALAGIKLPELEAQSAEISASHVETYSVGRVPALHQPSVDEYREVIREPRDEVKVSVFAPPKLVAGQSLLVQVAAHLQNDSARAARTAHEFDPSVERRGVTTLDIAIARGTRLSVGLQLPGVKVDDPVQSLVWRGAIHIVQFGVTAPRTMAARNIIGTVTVWLNDTAPVGHIKFRLEVVRPTSARLGPAAAPRPAGESARIYRTAFVSYASEDRVEVLKRVQLLPKFGIRLLQDFLTLVPGERWERGLYRSIDDSDVFMLFWSTPARHSKWVRREVRYALRRKGGDDLSPPEIIPVPIEGPPPVPPPRDLSHLHFNDPFLYYVRASEAAPFPVDPSQTRSTSPG